MMQFIDLKTQQERIRKRVDSAIAKVLEHGQYVMGPEVSQVEKVLARFANVQHCIACGNGTDALVLALIAMGIGANDVVLVPSFTFAATPEAVASIGAIPVFVDVLPDTFNIDIASVKRTYAACKKSNLSPKALIAVDLFGQPADYIELREFVDATNMHFIADAAQSFGASYHGEKVGGLADITTTSFFPAKPLGCYGDGGALFTNNEAYKIALESLRCHGQGKSRYEHTRIGLNSRLDTIQAAILLEKLAIFPEEIQERNRIADRYTDALEHCITAPIVKGDVQSAWAQYTIVTQERDLLQQQLREKDIPSVVYYPIPMHQQSAYQHFPKDPNGLSVTEWLAQHVLSLPMHPYLDSETQDKIVSAVSMVKTN